MLAVVKVGFLGSLVFDQFQASLPQTAPMANAAGPAESDTPSLASPSSGSGSSTPLLVAQAPQPDNADNANASSAGAEGERLVPVLWPRGAKPVAQASSDLASPATTATAATPATNASKTAPQIGQAPYSPHVVTPGTPEGPVAASAEDFAPHAKPGANVADDPQSDLARASASAALSLPRLLGTSVAYAADMPPVPPVMPPAPNVRPMDSPIAPERVVRPDEITPPAPPAPDVAPFVSRDSAAQKQAELNRREQELLALQQQMEARMAELHSLEGRIQGMLQNADTAQESKFKQLVDMYANMKPKQAAQALTALDEMIAVKILTGMKSKQSGEVLSYMNPTHAARLSEVMSKMQL